MPSISIMAGPIDKSSLLDTVDRNTPILFIDSRKRPIES